MASIDLAEDRMWFFSLPKGDFDLRRLLTDPWGVVQAMEANDSRVALDEKQPVTIIFQYDLRRKGSYLVQGEVHQGSDREKPLVAGNVITVRAPQKELVGDLNEPDPYLRLADKSKITVRFIEEDGDEGQTYLHFDFANRDGAPDFDSLVNLARNPWRLTRFLKVTDHEFDFGNANRAAGFHVADRDAGASVEGNFPERARISRKNIAYKVNDHPVILFQRTPRIHAPRPSFDSQAAAAARATGGGGGGAEAAASSGQTACAKGSGPYQRKGNNVDVTVGMVSAIPW